MTLSKNYKKNVFYRVSGHNNCSKKDYFSELIIQESAEFKFIDKS